VEKKHQTDLERFSTIQPSKENSSTVKVSGASNMEALNLTSEFLAKSSPIGGKKP
jgi:hypothetical protein